jgi:hypothetical protein
MSLAVEARTVHNIRHASLWLLSVLRYIATIEQETREGA